MEHHTIESLLNDSSWLRSICLQMTSDENLAEDLAQEGWLHVLRHGGSGVDAPRPWIRRVVHNIRVGGYRAQGPRQDRETDFAMEQTDRDACAPGPVEVLERAELRSLIAQAVLALEEPVRGTLMLRFFEDRSAAQVAAQQGVSVETVRKRTMQGLAQVRRELERRYPGEKGRLLPALFLAAGRGPVVAPTVLVPVVKSWGALAFGFLVMGCLVAFVALWANTQEPPEREGLQAVAPDRAEEDADQEVSFTQAAPAREALAEAAKPRVEPLSGYLWSGSTRAPLVGALRDQEGQVVCLAGRGGGFTLPAKWVGKELTASARNHSSHTLTVPNPAPGEAWKVELGVNVPTTLRILDEEGKPLEGVPIGIWPWGGAARTVASRDRWDELGAPFAYGKTDAQGMWSAMLGGQAAGRIEIEGGAMQFVSVEPGVMLTVLIPGRSLKVRFLDSESGEPVVGLRVRTPWVDSTANRGMLFKHGHYLTDIRGEVAMVHASQGGQFHVGASNVTELSLQNPEDSKWVTIQGRYERTVLVGASSNKRVLALLVKDDSLRIQLTDAQTGRDLEGYVTYGFNSIWRDFEGQVLGARRFRSGGYQGRLSKGIFRLNNIRGRRSEVARDDDHDHRRPEPFLRLSIEAPGYQVAHLSIDTLYEGLRTLHVSMQRVPSSTRRIRLVWQDGSPFWGEVQVYDKEDFGVLGGGRTDALGRLESMSAPRQLASVVARSTNKPTGGAVPIGRQGMRHRYYLEVEASAWESPGDVIVQVPGVPICGQITVTGVPKGSPEIIASDPMQFEHAPTQILEGSYVFENLPAGEYIVGPRTWVRALVAQRVYSTEGRGSPLIAMVDPNSTIVKKWRTDWYLEKALTGRVSCDPKVLAKAVLVARYGSARSAKATGVRRVDMDALGNYVIPAGDPRPVGLKLLFGEDRSGLATFKPGRDCKVVVGSIRFLATGGAESYEWVTINTKSVAPASDRATRLKAQHISMRIPISEQEFVLHALPMSIVQAVFQGKDGQRISRAVSMVPGGEVLVEY